MLISLDKLTGPPTHDMLILLVKLTGPPSHGMLILLDKVLRPCVEREKVKFSADKNIPGNLSQEGPGGIRGMQI